MNYTQAITLALAALNASMKLVAELKAQSGMTDEQLLDLATKNGQETRANIKAYIDSLK